MQNADSALQAHRVQASHGVPISTIPAQAGPGAESGLTGPGLRDLAEVLVTATARSPRPESVPAKTRRQPYSARCVRYGRAEKAQDGGANPGPADRGAGLHGGSVLRRLPGAGDIGGGSYRPRTVEERSPAGLLRTPALPHLSGIRRAVPARSRSWPVSMPGMVRFRTPGTHPGSAQIAGRVRPPACTKPCGQS